MKFKTENLKRTWQRKIPMNRDKNLELILGDVDIISYLGKK